jgi:hypothetical protein
VEVRVLSSASASPTGEATRVLRLCLGGMSIEPRPCGVDPLASEEFGLKGEDVLCALAFSEQVATRLG